MSAIVGISNRVTALEGGKVQEVTTGVQPEDVPNTPPPDLDLDDDGVIRGKQPAITENSQTMSAGADTGMIDPFQSS